jgi:hypothetical protein
MPNNRGTLMRVGKRMEIYLVNLKEKNNFRGVREASDALMDYLDGVKTRKIRTRKIIREIEF